jgi:ABC-2 type transport system ATP-binding protein
MMSEKLIVECKQISKYYGKVQALNLVSINIKEGESVAIVGANGAGKSTLFNIILGLLKPDNGICSIFCINSNSIKPSHRANIGFIADHASPVPWASSSEIANLYSKIYPNWSRINFENAVNDWSIDKNKRLMDLSKGQKRLAEMALIIGINPRILILDEPFDGLDAIMRIKTQNLLRTMQKERKTTILYATHILTELSIVADRLIVLKRGNVVYDQSIKCSQNTPENIFREHYFAEIAED